MLKLGIIRRWFAYKALRGGVFWWKLWLHLDVLRWDRDEWGLAYRRPYANHWTLLFALKPLED